MSKKLDDKMIAGAKDADLAYIKLQKDQSGNWIAAQKTAT